MFIDASAPPYNVRPGESAATNDAGIAAAIAQAASQGGGVVLLPPGILYVSQPIDLPSSITLSGAALPATRLVPSIPMTAMIRIIGAAGLARRGCHVEALTLECNERCDYGIELDYASDTNRIADVAARQATIAGIYLHDWHCQGVVLERVIAEYNQRGVWLGIASNMTRIRDSLIQYNVGAGLWMVESTNVLCESATFQHNGTGGVEQQAVDITGGHIVTFVGGYWEANGQGQGVDVNVHLGPYNAAENVMLIAPYFNGSADNPPAGALHAVVVDGEITVGVQNGKSNLHLGTTFKEMNGGRVQTQWFTSIDEAGLRPFVINPLVSPHAWNGPTAEDVERYLAHLAES